MNIKMPSFSSLTLRLAMNPFPAQVEAAFGSLVGLPLLCRSSLASPKHHQSVRGAAGASYIPVSSRRRSLQSGWCWRGSEGPDIVAKLCPTQVRRPVEEHKGERQQDEYQTVDQQYGDNLPAVSRTIPLEQDSHGQRYDRRNEPGRGEHEWRPNSILFMSHAVILVHLDLIPQPDANHEQR